MRRLKKKVDMIAQRFMSELPASIEMTLFKFFELATTSIRQAHPRGVREQDEAE
jgi:hypothetical protein